MSRIEEPSKFYARFKESREEIIAFPTQQQRDDWVNFQDEFSLATKNNAEITTFQRVPLTQKQANYIIKTLCLTETVPEYPTDENITIFRNVKGERKIMKESNKINLEPTMGITERKMIASATEKNAIKIGTKRLAWVPVELMNIAPYQREKKNHVNKIAEEWDDDLCDVLTVSYDEENGWFNVVDGQHRAIAAKMRGIEYLVSEIRTGLNISQEADYFVNQNRNSKKLNPYDEFKANQFISEEDDTELSILDKNLKRICDEYNIQVKKSEACGVLKSVPQARKILSNKNEGEECLRFIFDVIRHSHWDKLKNGYCYVIVNALRKVYDEHKDDLDFTKRQLSNRMIKSSYNEFDSIGMSKYPNLGRTARWDAVMSQIIA